MSEFINIFDYKDDAYPFQIFIGGRGTGKTYSAFKGALHLTKEVYVPKRFIWMRRTPKELDFLCDNPKKGEGHSDLIEINRNEGTNFGFLPISENMAGIYARETSDEGKYEYIGSPLGYGLPMTAIAGMRGANFSDCSDWFYDEFIPEKHVKKMRGECDALLNAYETINRNREFFGEPPMRLWMLANSYDIYSPIMVGLNLVSEAEKMVARNQPHRYYPDRGLALHILPPSAEFKKKKQETALYKLTRGTEFYKTALNNDFAYNDFSLIEYRNLKGYRPIAALDNAYLYKKKGESEIYISYATAHVPTFNSKVAQDVIRFRREYGTQLHPFFVKGKLIFESYDLKEKILNIII